MTVSKHPQHGFDLKDICSNLQGIFQDWLLLIILAQNFSEAQGLCIRSMSDITTGPCYTKQVSFQTRPFFLLGLWFITSLNVVTLVCIEWPLRFTPISCINDQFCRKFGADESPANCRKLWYYICKLLATYLANWFLMVLGVWRKGHKVKFRVRVTESRVEKKKWQVESGLKVD